MMKGDSMSEKVFEGWAIIELFEHQKIAGLCSEQPLAGTNMLRVDVPAVNRNQAFTRFFGGSAIYSITPTDEATVMTALGSIETRPVDRWVVPDRAAIPQQTKFSYPVGDDEDDDDMRERHGY
jgi:hypothetical protein